MRGQVVIPEEIGLLRLQPRRDPGLGLHPRFDAHAQMGKIRDLHEGLQAAHLPAPRGKVLQRQRPAFGHRLVAGMDAVLESAEAGEDRQRRGRRPGGTAAVLGEAAAASGKPPEVRRGLRSDRVEARAFGGEQDDVVGFGRLSPTAPGERGGGCRQQQRARKSCAENQRPPSFCDFSPPHPHSSLVFRKPFAPPRANLKLSGGTFGGQLAKRGGVVKHDRSRNLDYRMYR